MAKKKKIEYSLSLWEQIKNPPVKKYTLAPLTLESLKELFNKMYKEEEEIREWKRKTNWKPEFFINSALINSLSYEELESLSEHYKLIGGSEAVEAVKRKIKEHDKITKKKPNK